MPYFCSVVVVLTILYAFPSVSSTIPRLDSDRQNRNPLLSPGVPVELIAADTRENAALFNRLLKGALTMNKRATEEWDDPRFLSSAFGKRASMAEWDDPRFLSSAFGKRSGMMEFDDPRFFSSSYGKRAFMSPLKRYVTEFDDPRLTIFFSDT
ncbi:hypothetical protein Tcan_03604 [Toxocara canis]|uniref:Uncharacterized protein n=1 Tax=Toxocara canis TaxID=6265 RepID=A0A0B2V878_TOXCA|nr:hypothetical protein Tcan_03604 [Toxocara canis]